MTTAVMVMLKMELEGAGNLIRQIELFDRVSIKKIGKHFPKVLDLMQEEKDKNFKTKGGSLVEAPKRAPLKKKTKDARNSRSGYYKQSPNRPSTLRWTGNLQDNIDTKHTDTTATMTFMADYAGYHQRGKGLNRRALFEFNRKINTEIIRTIQTELNKEIRIRNLRGKKY